MYATLKVSAQAVLTEHATHLLKLSQPLSPKRKMTQSDDTSAAAALLKPTHTVFTWKILQEGISSLNIDLHNQLILE